MNRLAVVLGGALLVVGIVALVLLGELRSQRAGNAQLAQRVAALEESRRPSITGAPVVPVPATADGPQPAAASPAGAQASPGAEVDSFGTLVRQMLDTDEGREYARSITATALARQYPDLEKELGLTEEEARSLIDLLALQRTQAGSERISLMTGTQDAAARAALSRDINAQVQAHEGEVAALLGDRYPQWKEYQRTAAARQREDTRRRQAEELRRAVSAGGRAVDDAQFDLLRAALQAEEQRIQVESRGFNAQQQLQDLPEQHRRLLDVAAGYLDPAQLDGYRRHLRQQADMARMVVGAMGLTGAAQATAPQPAD